jgi:hypothetical protein
MPRAMGASEITDTTLLAGTMGALHDDNTREIRVSGLPSPTGGPRARRSIAGQGVFAYRDP